MRHKGLLLMGITFAIGCASSQEASVELIAANVEKSAIVKEKRKQQVKDAVARWQELLGDLESNDSLIELRELKNELNAILLKDPAHLEARYNRGRLAKQEDDSFVWQQDFKILAQQHPEFYPGIVGAVEACTAQKKPFEAIALLERFTQARPNHLQARLRLAQLHWSENDPLAALDHVQKLLKNSPAGAREPVQFAAHGLAIRSYLKLKKLAPARLILERVAQAWPKDSRLHGLRAEFQEAEGNSGANLKGLEEFVELEPTDVKLRIRLINGLLEVGDFGRAMPHLLELEAKSSAKAPIQRLLAKSYQRVGQFEDAARAHRRLLKETPKDPTTLWNHAQLLELNLRIYPRAIDYYQELRSVRPDWPGLGEALDRVVQLHRVAQASIEAERTKNALRGQVLEVCASAVAGQAPEFGVVGDANLLKELAWEMMEGAQKEGVNGNYEMAASQVRCAKQMVRAAGDPDGEQCTSMVAIWGQSLLEIGQWEEALEAVWGAQDCLKSGQNSPTSGAFAEVQALETKLQTMLGPDGVKALKERLELPSKPVDL